MRKGFRRGVILCYKYPQPILASPLVGYAEGAKLVCEELLETMLDLKGVIIWESDYW